MRKNPYETLGEALKKVYGHQTAAQLAENAKYHQQNKEYWRAKEAAMVDGIKIPGRTPIQDLDFRIPTGIKELRKFYGIDALAPIQRIYERNQADINKAKQISVAEKLYESEEYERVRGLEESVYRGEHSLPVLEMAKARSHFWTQINPSNVSENFLVDQLRFSKSDAMAIRKGGDKNLRNLFSSRMGEFELIGHLPKTEFFGNMAASGPNTRVVNFGQYSNEPGSFFSSMLPSGKSAYIAAEQQRSFISNVFGRTRLYRFAGSGKIVSPDQMKKIRIIHQSSNLEGMSDLTKFRTTVENRLGDYKKLADLERSGKLIKREEVDPFSFKAGTPGKRGKMLETGDDEGMSLFELMEKEVLNPEVEAEDAPIQTKAPGQMSREEMDAYAAKLTGMSSEPAPEEFVSGSSKGELSYVERPRFYENQYKSLKEQYNKAFIFKMVKSKNAEGRMVRQKELVDYHPLLRERFKGALGNLIGENVDLTNKSMEEAEQIIESSLGKGAKVKMLEGRRYNEITSSAIENFGQLSLMGDEPKSSKLFTEFTNDIPLRAQSDQVLDAYFKRIAGKKAYGVYTASGTYLGETRGTQGVPKTMTGAAKIFEYKGKYSVGWSASHNTFSWNRFGEVEQSILSGIREKNESEKVRARIERRSPSLVHEPKEVNTLYDLEESNRLMYSRESQDTLEKIYKQRILNLDLISKYKYDKLKNTYIDTGNMSTVDKITGDMYMANVENSYRRSSKARDILERSDPTASGSKTWKISEALKGFSQRIPKLNNMIGIALGVSAALVTLSAVSNRRQEIGGQEDVSRSTHGSNTNDQRMFSGTSVTQQTARIVPEYQGRQGYTTNIDIRTTDNMGVNPSELAFVMDRHARVAMGTKSSGVNVEINDNSDQSDQYALQRKYTNMMRI